MSDRTSGSSQATRVPSVQELVLKDPHALPDGYIAFLEQRPFLVKDSAKYGIPVIDFSRLLNSQMDEDRKTEMRKLSMACEHWGFFQVVNHGISPSLMQRMRVVVREFFQLPPEEKQEYSQQPRSAMKGGHSNQGYGQASVVSEDQRLDWADILYLTTLPIENRNMRFWPSKPVDFRKTVAEYSIETEKLGCKLLSLLAENLDLRPHDYFFRMFGKWSERMRMNYYPPCPRPDLVLGLRPHSDGSGLTMLLQDDRTEGLHVHKDGEWVAVQIIPSALVINIGDTLEMMSNGRYQSIEHRAVTNKENDRISIAAFYSPTAETEIGPAPDLIDDLHPCLYRRIKRGEYLALKLGNGLEGKKALDSVKIQNRD